MSGEVGAILMQAPGPPGGGIFEMIFPFAMIFLIFYFLLIRPQQKKQREHDAMLKAVEKGDSVVTSGGIHGRVTGVTDDILTIEVAALKGEKVRLKVSRDKLDSMEKAKKGEGA